MVVICLLGVISLITFSLYAIDKHRAKKGARRIPERVLLGFSLLGGGIGGALGMSLFRHKTKHLYFVFLNTAGIAIQIAAVIITLTYLQ